MKLETRFCPVTIASADGEKQAACEEIELNCAVQPLRIAKLLLDALFS